MNKLARVGHNACKDDKILERLRMLACFLSNISQLPYFVSSGITRMLNMPVWVLVLGYLVMKGQIQLTHKIARPLYALYVVIAGMLVLSIFWENSYFNSSVFSNLFLSLFIYCLGGFAGRYISEEGLRAILWTYAVSAFLVSVSIYTQFFASGFDLSSRVYAYSSKNSISQIILTSVMILMFLKANERKTFKYIKALIILFEIVIMVLLRSRATIVGFLACLIYIILGKQFNKKLKKFLLLMLFAGIVVVLTNSKISNIVFDQILFAGRDASDIDALTSGRASILKTFPTRIAGHWLTGVGALYFECFPLSVILQFGIVIGPIILGISYLPIISCFFYKQNQECIEIFTSVCVIYAINSVFEGLAPIGPGAKCYFMWLLYGLILGQQKRIWMQQEAG